jgi:hypothetical protein
MATWSIRTALELLEEPFCSLACTDLTRAKSELAPDIWRRKLRASLLKKGRKTARLLLVVLFCDVSHSLSHAMFFVMSMLVLYYLRPSRLLPFSTVIALHCQYIRR